MRPAMKYTEKQAAQLALDVQTACNLLGVIYSFARVAESLRPEMDTPTFNTHPVCRLFAEQISHLTDAGMGDSETYHKAYDACHKLVGE